jgi:hypothetical protein
MAQSKDYSILIWGPAAFGDRTSQGRVLPAGWVWSCECGASGVGLASEDAAERKAAVHEEHHRRAAELAQPTLKADES